MLDALLNDRGSVTFSVKPKIGPGAAKTAAIMPAATDEDRAADKYEFSYPETMPWLKRLREADVQKPCRDMRFLVGSCRYPGTPFESEASDAIFKGMLPHIEGPQNGVPGVHMLFLIGDQIYADATANILDSRAWRERYGQRYRLAFTSKHARTVLAHLPTHFAIDDHEISDNWSGEAKRSKEVLHAVQSAKCFQSSGRETLPINPPREKRLGTALWYSLSERQEHCCPAFVMDTRSEREPRGYNAPGTQLVSIEQRTALADWLGAVNQGPSSNMPKFIFCGVGIAPISREFAAFGQTWRSQDWWPGYPRTLSDILFKILTEGIRHVVFVSGDLHLSSASKLTLGHRDTNDVATVWQVVSSGLYAPMPFASAQPAAYDWNTPVRLPRHAAGDVDVVAESGLLYSGRPHLLRLDAEQRGDDWSLSIGVVGSSAEGAFLAPAGKPPSGFVEHGPRWRVHLASRRRGIAPVPIVPLNIPGAGHINSKT